MKKEFWIVAAVVVVIVGVGIYFASKSSTSSTSGVSLTPPDHSSSVVGAKDFLRSYSHSTASPTAPVTLIEFGDYQCPVCGAAYEPIKTITDRYASDPNFNFVFRNFPLPQHEDAQLAASAAEAAGAQGKYFEMHDLLYSNQNDWSGSTDPMSYFTKYAQQLSLNVDQFNSDTESYKYFTNVDQDMQDGNAFGVNATPTFYVIGGSSPTQYVGTGDITGSMSTQLDTLMKAADAKNPVRK
jgi:protein-disulfide isomerase